MNDDQISEDNDEARELARRDMAWAVNVIEDRRRRGRSFASSEALIALINCVSSHRVVIALRDLKSP